MKNNLLLLVLRVNARIYLIAARLKMRKVDILATKSREVFSRAVEGRTGFSLILGLLANRTSPKLRYIESVYHRSQSLSEKITM